MSIWDGPLKFVECCCRRRLAPFAVLLCVFLLFGLQVGFVGLAQSAAAPDPSFGKDGRVITKFAGVDNIILATALAPDGSIYAAGFGKTKGHRLGVIAKYAANGDLDQTFGQRGSISDEDFDGAQAIALQSNGQVLVAGVYTGFATGGPAYVLKRYNGDGSLDSGFGSGGRVLDSIGPAGDFIDAIAVQSNGQILVGGNTEIVVGLKKHNQAINGDFALARYNSDGSADASFGSNGKVITDFDGQFDSIKQIVVQPNGQIVAAGQAGVPASSLPNPVAPAGSVAVFGFARYNSNGSLDGGFGSGGLVTVAVNGVGSLLATVTLLSNGQILAGGATSLTLAFARLNSNGSLDPAFGIGGQFFVPLLTQIGCEGFTDCNAVFSGAMAIAPQSDGTFLAYGGLASEAVHFFAVSYNQDGSLNTAFGSNGILTAKFMGVGEINSVLIQQDGKVVAGGRAKVAGSRNQFELARYIVPGS